MRGGKQHGNGMLTYPDGATYEGEFRNGLRDGTGEFKWELEDLYYKGKWSKGKFEGDAECGWPKNTVWEGRFENG